MVTNINSSNVIVTQDGRKYEKPSNMTVAAGILAGNATGTLVTKPILTGSGEQFVKEMDELVKNFSKDGKYASKIPYYKDVIKNAFDKTGLGKKGVSILEATESNREAIYKSLIASEPKYLQKLIEKLPDTPLSKQFKNNVNETINGLNAFYSHAKKNIIVNMEKSPILAFHEMGHALNYNSKGIAKVLSAVRNPMLKAAGLISVIAVFKRKKQEGEEPTGLLDKVTTFIKNNCGKITMMLALPTVLEEGLATVKGLKIAKSAGLSESALNQIKTTNAKGLITYIGVAAALSIGTVVASKIRDMVAKPKEIA